MNSVGMISVYLTSLKGSSINSPLLSVHLRITSRKAEPSLLAFIGFELDACGAYASNPSGSFQVRG